MLRFSANLTMLFNEAGFLERFALAAKAGFKGAEYKDPYACKMADVVAAAKDSGLETVLFNMPSGDWAGGERGLGCLPGREQELREGVAMAIEYAIALKCTRINLLGGIPPKGVDLREIRSVFVGNLRHAATELKKHGIRLVIEPVNTYDSPGVFLTKTEQAVDIIREVGADNLGIEYDVYQAQLMEGDLTNTLKKHMPLIWHMQVADVPSRAEPGTGEINYEHVLGVIEKAGYQGWIGCDYKPSTRTTTGSFGWMKNWDPVIARSAG
jgi:hydroxypyruvate isomerase